MNDIRTRMAPSPTGEYHIGHIRTVLYNYAFAKKNNGKFIIRIEDTDRERYVPGAVERILSVIEDYGLSWDEGPNIGGDYGPYIQSERLDLYKKYAEKLISDGHAYYCFCTKERLDEMRVQQQAAGLAKTMYDGHCRELLVADVQKELENKTPYVIRLKVPKDEQISFTDLVFGDIEFNSDDLDDTVLLKTDGYPTYHLAVVVDDHLMEITHILRGNDWLPSTPKHVLLYKYFGWEMPKLVHLPNLKENGENKKLSKRFGAVFALEFLREGYLPEALLNFLMFLGWNPGGEKEIYSLDEFVAAFDLTKIHKVDLVAFDREKLLWMNGYYLRNMSPNLLLEKIENWAKKFEVELPTKNRDENFNIQVTSLIQERLKKLSEFTTLSKYFYVDPEPNIKSVLEFAGTAERAREIIQGFHTTFGNISESAWLAKNIDEQAHIFIQKNGYKPKEAFMTLRIVLTGETATPPVFDILEVIGKDHTQNRLVYFLSGKNE